MLLLLLLAASATSLSRSCAPVLLPQGDHLATVSEVDRRLVMQCFHENYRRCGTGVPSAEAKSCGCTLAAGRVPHHSVMPDFVGTLRAWAVKRPTQEERGLVSRLSRFQDKKQQETAAVAAILTANGLCIRELKTKYAKSWCTAKEKAQKQATALDPAPALAQAAQPAVAARLKSRHGDSREQRAARGRNTQKGADKDSAIAAIRNALELKRCNLQYINYMEFVAIPECQSLKPCVMKLKAL